MNQRVDEREWIQYQWDYLVALLGGESRLTRLAYETGAFTRRRKVESPVDLLRLILTWAVGERSLEETAALAAETGLADVSDVALLGRFRRAGEWLGAILGDQLAGRSAATGASNSTDRCHVYHLSREQNHRTTRAFDLGSGDEPYDLD